VTFINPLRARWRAGEATLGAWLQSRDVLVAEALASSGFDHILVDQQHGSASASDLPALFMAIAAGGSVPLTRVPVNDAMAIGRSLDLGALGIVVPMVNSREEAERAVAACRYAPGGIRSWGPIRAGAVIGSTDPAEIDHAPVLIVQVETEAAVDAVEAIAATPGIDAILIGPADLGLSLGMSPHGAQRSVSESVRHAAAVGRVREACDRAGIAAAMYCTDGACAGRHLDQGFRMINVVTDIALVRGAALAELARAREGEPGRVRG
jgi:4-hydroxy-2-oxoheptanedioate aldolase